MKQNGLLNLVKQVQAWPIQPCNDYRFISEEFVIVRSVVGMRDLKQFSDRFRTTLSIDGRAYRASAFGYVRIRANLHDLTIKAHQMVVASPVRWPSSWKCLRIVVSMVGIANSFMEGWQKEEQLMRLISRGSFTCGCR
ncbi:MAG: hypothetical protein ACLU4J_09250 [Butyricimonas paravirosa]